MTENSWVTTSNALDPPLVLEALQALREVMMLIPKRSASLRYPGKSSRLTHNLSRISECSSRDRNSEYARGVHQRTLHALQVADRFYLARNLAEVPECILSHHRKVIKHIHLIMSAASPGPLAVRYICAERAQRKTRQHQVLLESYIR